MAEKKSIYEEALLDAQRIQEALNANTKEILRSVAREEIDGVVKESLMEDDYEEETVSDETNDETGSEDSTDVTTDVDSGAEGGEAEVGADSGEAEIQPSDEVGLGDQESGMDADALGGDELDMTAASDDAIIAIYKKLSGDDEIEVVGDDVHVNISEPGEYIIKGAAALGGGSETEVPAAGLDTEVGDDTDDWEEVGGAEGGDEGTSDESGDDLDYEIEMDDETDDDSENPINENKDEVEETVAEEEAISEEETEKDEDVVEEQIPVGLAQSKRIPAKADIGAPKGAGAAGLKESVSLENKYKAALNEAAQLKTENEEFKKALKKFRNMLVETVVFNSNLSYVAKLFMEHSTTRDEKKKIIQRFDEEVTNLKESKKLYKTIVNELAERKPITEAVESKIIKEVSTGTSTQLNEVTAYVDPSTQRIKDLINRVENR